jgi:hypothetical protein
VKTYEDIKNYYDEVSIWPTVTVVQLLSGAAEDDTLPDRVRSMSKGWLARLVDEEGNPLDDFGRDPSQWAAEENALNSGGSLTKIERHDDRDILTFVLSHRARDVAEPESVRKQLRDHFTALADQLTEHLFSPSPTDRSDDA